MPTALTSQPTLQLGFLHWGFLTRNTCSRGLFQWFVLGRFNCDPANTGFKHHGITPCSTWQLCLEVLNDPTASDFREESLIRASWSYTPVARSEDSQNQANDIVTLGNVALLQFSFLTLSQNRKKHNTLDILDIQKLGVLHDTCFVWLDFFSTLKQPHLVFFLFFCFSPRSVFPSCTDPKESATTECFPAQRMIFHHSWGLGECCH